MVVKEHSNFLATDLVNSRASWPGGPLTEAMGEKNICFIENRGRPPKIGR
jgi:hypothetical protein